MNEKNLFSSDADNLESEKTLSRKEKLKLKKKSRKKRLRQEEYEEKSKEEEEVKKEIGKFDVPLPPDTATIPNDSKVISKDESEEEEEPHERKRVLILFIN